MCRLSRVGLMVLIAVAFAGRAGYAQIPAWDFTGGVAFTKVGDATAGQWFTVTSKVTVNRLGFWDEGADGLGESHQVGLWNSIGTLLASTTVTNGSTVRSSTAVGGRWLTEGVGDLLLTPGEYVVGAFYVDASADQARLIAPLLGFSGTYGPILSGISNIEAANDGAGGIFEMPGARSGFPGGFYEASANVFYQSAGAPEGSSFAMLGLGLLPLAGMVIRRRMRSRY